MPKEASLIRLEQALRWWEDASLCEYLSDNYGIKRIPFSGIPVPWPQAKEFRNYLIQSFGRELDYKRFFSAFDAKRRLPLTSSLPISIHAWTNSSRRAYRLSLELQTLLLATELDGVAWGDIHLPFNSFAILPAFPFVDNKGCAHDCVIVSKIKKTENSWYLLFNYLCDELDALIPFTDEEREKLEKYAKRGRKNIVDKILVQHRRATIQIPRIQAHWAIYPTELSQNIVDDLEKRSAEQLKSAAHRSLWAIEEQVLRVVIGLCLHLRSLPSNPKIPQPRWAPGPRDGKNQRSIFDGSEVCTVQCEEWLDTKTTDVISRLQPRKRVEFIETHFRRGHWRRPPGKGNDPSFPKIVKVKPALVNARQLEDGEVPGGNLTNIES